MDFNSFLNIPFFQALMHGHQDIDKAIVDIPNIYNYWRKNNQIFQLIFFVLFISLAFLFIRPTSDHCLVLSVFSRLFECCSNCWICQSCYLDFSNVLHMYVKTRQSKQCGFSIYTFDNFKSKSMVSLVRAEKMVLSGLVFARKIARMILIQNMTHSQMLGKFEYTRGPIFKVVLEC